MSFIKVYVSILAWVTTDGRLIPLAAVKWSIASWGGGVKRHIYMYNKTKNKAQIQLCWLFGKTQGLTKQTKPRPVASTDNSANGRK